MTIDAARAGLAGRGGRAPARPPRDRAVTSAGSCTARGSSATASMPAGRSGSISMVCACRSSGWKVGVDGRPSRCRRRGTRPRRRSLEWSGARLSRTSPQRPDDGRPEAGRHPGGRAARNAAGLRSPARRPRGERAQPARHASRPRAQGVSRSSAPSGRAGRDRRPAASLRSSRDGDARGRGVERARSPARLEFREAIHGTRPLGGDRRPCRPHRSSESESRSARGSSARRASPGSIGWDERELVDTPDEVRLRHRRRRLGSRQGDRRRVTRAAAEGARSARTGAEVRSRISTSTPGR